MVKCHSHRLTQDQFECSQADMVHWGPELRSIETEADDFASNLLMPMKQFRVCTSASEIDFDILSDASTKFGVSLTAAVLRWIRSTAQSAVLILSRDGFMDWAISSDKARTNGAFSEQRDASSNSLLGLSQLMSLLIFVAAVTGNRRHGGNLARDLCGVAG